MNILDSHTHDSQATDAVICLDDLNAPLLPGKAYSAGIHPWNTADTDPTALLHRVGEMSHNPSVVAIGETGIDKLRGASIAVQADIFGQHIAIAEAAGKPLIIHNVRATQEIIAVWKTTAPHHVAAVIHGFRGNANVAAMLLNQGFYLSYGPHFNTDALAVTPSDRILVETDDSGISINAILAATGIDENIIRQNASRFFGTNP